MPEDVTLASHANGPEHDVWLAANQGVALRDCYPDQLAELAAVRLPGGSAAERLDFAKQYQAREPGVWSCYPWLNLALRTLEPDALFELRTNRNQNLLTAAEQARLRLARIAIAGLSVGSNIVSALVHNGIGAAFCLADHDELATSNLNRVFGRMTDVGTDKAQLAARAVWETDPFARCVLYADPLGDDTVEAFVAGSALVFDEVDDFRLKVQLRLMARRHRIPLLMATNLGDTVLIDVERWDAGEPGLEPFNGQLDGVSAEELMRADLSPQDVSRFAARVIGVANVPLRALASLPLIGTELVGRPQLASTASVAAGAAALAARSVLLGAPLRSGRYRIDLAEALGLPADRGSEAERAAIMARLQPPAPAAGPACLRPALPELGTLAGGDAGALRSLAAYATLAPSPHNTQPWLFGCEGQSLTIAANQARALPAADPAGRARAISLGCAAMSALVAAAAAGLGARAEIGTWSVRVVVAGTEADPELASLFPALAARVTDKRGYPPDHVEPPAVDLPSGIWVHYLTDQRSREEMARLHREAVAGLAAGTAFGRELAGWLRADPADPRRDGMTLPLPPAAAGALVAALAESGKPLAELGERDAQALAAGPVLGLLTSAEQSPQAWILAGLAWQRLALTAQLGGLAVAPLTAVVENPATCQAAAALVPPGQHPLMLFRLGRSPGPLPPTPRRDPAWS